ncbi:putative oxidoreductase [Pseudocercospora fuligena]|uniref:Putative oxidoreductase n=1 Tax=Pseudocercospora fuligena TaxID=685502 RepID=A0A8H6RFQ0_9PEZI|nr:putative oxidoreductase [Pseudocercospora fuligena]
MPTHGALVVFGSGPGVGRNVAALFAEKGFKQVVLISRNAERLSQDADMVRSASPKAAVYTVPVDLGDTEAVQKGLERVEECIGETTLEFVLFNAARTGKSEFFDFSAGQLQSDFQIAVIGLYTVAQWAIPKLLHTASNDTSSTPSFLITSGMLAKDPFPAMFSLGACKAAQYSLATSLHKEFESKGVHCGVIIIGGTVSDDSKVTNARNIAEETYKMFRQRRGHGELELMLADPGYEDHVKNREK